MDMAQAVRDRLKYLIKKHKVSINGLARDAGIGATTLKNVLSGDSHNPGVVTIKRLCDGLGISVQDFFMSPEFDTLEEQDDFE